VQAQILDLLRALRQRRQLSLLLITHDLGVVAQMADRVAVMYGGRIAETAAVGDLFASPQHPYTQGLLQSVPDGRAGSRLAAIDGVVPTLDTMPPGCAFAPRCARRIDRCDREVPPTFTVGDRHDARCWLHATEAGA
jgi:oligopeptide/dipeptide ABC transporter ATP-binding protein